MITHKYLLLKQSHEDLNTKFILRLLTIFYVVESFYINRRDIALPVITLNFFRAYIEIYVVIKKKERDLITIVISYISCLRLF